MKLQEHILSAAFFEREAPLVARALLGKYLVRTLPTSILAYMVTETEAYSGAEDRASHSRFGKTSRTAAMFGPSGHWYVYFIYGMYWMLNVVTGQEDYPQGVLIRGAGIYDGPGKVTRALHINKSLYGLPASPQSGLWVEDMNVHIPDAYVDITPRIGIAYAGDYWAQVPYRFVIKPDMRRELENISILLHR